MANELSTTLEALAHLLDVHHIGTVIARSRLTDERGVTEFDFTTKIIHRAWSITDLATGTAETNHHGLATHVNRTEWTYSKTTVAKRFLLDASGSPVRSPTTTVGYTPEFLDIHVHKFARSLAFVADGRGFGGSDSRAGERIEFTYMACRVDAVPAPRCVPAKLTNE